MKKSNKPLLLRSLAVILLSVSMPLNAASNGLAEIVYLDFSNLDTVGEGGALTGSFMGKDTAAYVSMGQVYALNEAAELSGGEDITPGAIAIKIPEILPLSPMELSFSLAQPKNQSAACYLFEIRLRDIARGEEYTVKLSPNVGYFGLSGVNSFNDAGDEIAGCQGACLNGFGDAQLIQVAFDPDTGIRVLKDGNEVAAFRNFKQLEKIDRIELLNNPAGGGVIHWVIDDVKVSGRLRGNKQ